MSPHGNPGSHKNNHGISGFNSHNCGIPDFFMATSARSMVIFNSYGLFDLVAGPSEYPGGLLAWRIGRGTSSTLPEAGDLRCLDQ